ncbi:MAG: NADH-quinone oxidoreductase subunit L [Anaeromyxobacter sp.]
MLPNIPIYPGPAASSLWAIILFPLAGAIVNGLFGKRIGRANVTLVALGAMAGSLTLAIIAFSWTFHGNVLVYQADPWFSVPSASGGRPMIDVSWGLLADRLSGTMILVVTFVGSLIHIYSASYMSHEDGAGYARYFTYLNLFVAAMLVLVLGDSLVTTFVGWEGVGLCSYLLIGFWYTDPQKAYAGRKAFVTNRIGDFGFLVGAFSLISLFGTANYQVIQGYVASGAFDPASVVAVGPFGALGWTWEQAITFALLGLFIGAAGKSAQLPLYVWLPDAMAGPTPVSALIHAATMVTAGVYLVARNNVLFTVSPTAMAVVTVVGAATALFAALIAFVQNDIKKVLAYSTVSQLGFMFIGVGVGAWWAGVLHLVTHAFFKACLFLGAGSVMHGMGDETDVQKMGGLARKMPHTAITFGIATLAITGFVPLSGFFSKDAILGNALFSHNPAAPWAGPLAYGLGTAAALGTAFYMTRVYLLTFAGKPRTPAAEHAHESSPAMTAPLWILAVLAVLGLFLGLPGHSAVSELFQRYMAPVFANGTRRLHALEFLHEGDHPAWPFFAAWLVAAAGTAVAWLFYAGPMKETPAALARGLGPLYRFTLDKFRVDELYGAVVLRPFAHVSRALWRFVDVFVIDGLVNGVGRTMAFLGAIFRTFQNGELQRYAALMALAAAFVLGTVVWSVLGTGGF